MSKLTSLYHTYLKERDDLVKEKINGSDALQELIRYLQTNLNAAQFSPAEGLLQLALVAVEETGFKDGAKYTFGLGLELAGKEEVYNFSYPQ